MIAYMLEPQQSPADMQKWLDRNEHVRISFARSPELAKANYMNAPCSYQNDGRTFWRVELRRIV